MIETPPGHQGAAFGLQTSLSVSMSAQVEAFDFSTTPLGDSKRWPQSLRTAVRIVLSSRYAMWMAWGPELTFLYNDAYLPTLGIKRNWALGAAARDVWAEIWPDIGPRIERVLTSGQATWDEGLQLFLERSGYSEETYHTFSYSPLSDDDGVITGMLCVVTEETERVIGERRLATLRFLASRLSLANTETEVCAAVTACLDSALHDLPFALMYLVDGSTGARLASRSGAVNGHAVAPRVVDLGSESAPWPLHEVVAAAVPVEVDLTAARFADVPRGAWPKPPSRGLVLPIAGQGQAGPTGALVVGLNPYRPFDEAYRSFLDLFVGQIAAGLANAHAYEAERQRAEALAEIDRAKTAFFSNVSHEFRTPLTLMLGPLQDTLALENGALPDRVNQELQVVHRNGLRLLRLVNTLLDFSRIEAGRVRASFELVDLGQLTVDLASVFRSATDKAGLYFDIEAPPQPVPVYVDRDMWEKIVLNLVSNAFKFTLAGGIQVRVTEHQESVEVIVADTGCGVPEPELPRLFERFHRVAGTRGRTHEGTGIGLALVQELVRLHSGEIAVTSELGRGTTFSVTLRKGAQHLPKDRVQANEAPSSTAVGTSPFVEEALRWVPGETRIPERAVGTEALARERSTAAQAGHRERIIVADDNADMREYLRRLLEVNYDVVAVADGNAALEATRAQRPALVLSDVMMPGLDGIGLISAIRQDPVLATLPVILLSARAGEEATLDGIRAGADDYLIKPFSARDLTTRIAAQIQRQRFEHRLESVEQRLHATLAAARMATWEWDPATDELIGSWTMAEVYGLRMGEILTTGAARLECVHPEDIERLRSALERATQGEATGPQEFRVVRGQDGGTTWLEERFHRAVDPHTGQAKLVGLTIDLSARKEAELAIQRSEQRARFIVDFDDALRTLSDPHEMAQTSLRFIAQYFDTDRALYVELEDDEDVCTVVGEYSGPHPSIAGSYRISDYGADYRESVRANRAYVEHDATRQDIALEERERYARLGVGAFISAPVIKGGRLVAMFVVHEFAPRVWQDHEIEEVGLAASRCWEAIERARVARALSESEERVKISVEAGELGTFYCPMPLGTILWNDKCKEHFWLPPDARVDIDLFYQIIHEDDREHTRRAVNEAVYNRRPYDVEYRTVAPDGRWRWIRAKGKAYYDVAGRPTRFDGVTLDVSELKAAERLREESLVAERLAREEAERVNRMKDEFLATLSHELRTPLNAIMGWAQVLSLDTKEPRVFKQGLDAILSNARAQTQMIEDLLDMSRIVSGKLRLDVQPVALAEVIEQAMHSVRPMADGRSVRLTTVLDPYAGPVSGDPARLQQVLWNLLTNAIKFTPKGGKVQVVLERVNSHIEVSVVDTGEGISADFLPHVFGRFRQADASTTRRHGGLGLGLSIVKQLIDLHGGSVSVKSPGKGMGSTFTLSLPLAVARHDASLTNDDARHHPGASRRDQSSVPLPDLSGVSVLVVDDDPDAREIMRKIISRSGAEVVTADSAANAFEVLQMLRPTLLISDIGMPVEDGYDLIRRVRELSVEDGGKTPAVALTAFARSEDRQRALLAGYQMHLSKPVEPLELLAVCASVAGRVS